ncbi:MAG: hypothetical protein M5U26_12350 [Planctomycetota bacterium]|nr:hypothetical protein [Planctomycetota bacterium]
MLFQRARERLGQGLAQGGDPVARVEGRVVGMPGFERFAGIVREEVPAARARRFQERLEDRGALLGARRALIEVAPIEALRGVGKDDQRLADLARGAGQRLGAQDKQGRAGQRDRAHADRAEVRPERPALAGAPRRGERQQAEQRGRRGEGRFGKQGPVDEFARQEE